MIAYPYAYADLAETYRLPPQIECVLNEKLRQSSVLLGTPPAGHPVAALMETSTAYAQALAVLPVDSEADSRIEKLLAPQPQRGTRKPLRRK